MSFQSIGPYNIMKLAVHNVTGKKYAVKIMTKKEFENRSETLERARREIAVQKLIKHPNLIKLYDVYETKNYFFMILEYIPGGELFDYIVKNVRIQSSEARKFFQQIIYAVEHLHLFSIAHRDLKPENLLLDNNNNIKIADFGMAKIIERKKLFQTTCGSPHYVSPELIKRKGYDGKKSDIWACGVILYAILCGCLPFDEDEYQTLLLVITQGKFEFPEFLQENEKDLIQKMLIVDPKKRITIQEIKKHPWFTYNFPPKYVPPLPPINDYAQEYKSSISLDKIDLKTLKKLQELGFTDENEILESLTSNEQNIMKIFYSLLKKQDRETKRDQITMENEDEQIIEKNIEINEKENEGNEYNNNNTSNNKNNKKKDRPRRKSLPIKKRKSSISRIKKSGLLSPRSEKTSLSLSAPKNNYYSNEGNNIIKLKELIEKTDKENNLAVSEYSNIISKIINEKIIITEKKKMKTKKKFNLSPRNKKNNYFQNEFEKIKKKKKKAFEFENGNKSNPIEIKTKNKKKQKFNLKVKVSNQKFKHKNRPLSPLNNTGTTNKPMINIMEKETIHNENIVSDDDNDSGSTDNNNDNDNDHLKINQNRNNDLNMKKQKKKFQNLKINISNNKEIKSNTDYSNKDFQQENNITSLGTPRFHRMDRQELFQQPKTPTQEEIGLNTHGWFNNTISKKEQKKLNKKLKKELKIAKTSLLKNLKQNENLPFFFCNDRIIAVSSGSVLKVITELQTILSVFNFKWSYPCPHIIKASQNKTSMKIRIIEANLENIINLIASNMIEHNKIKKKKSNFTSEKEQLNRFSLELSNAFDQLTTVTKRNWKFTLEFIWKTGSSKKFIHETENLINFLSE
ncbi:serine/threonine-protein kinase brsk2-like protein [Anaeramoeba flamelloides]|uniref:Serine/threonine-protein kinase brsk2-like protein n=1 Tax=Anaeramoeba flamelloides TaxID=1746091 RepID=A0AAV7ZYZ3_9EUKA|nr:serine/threonine-protein kinase brsk2-like protein [Anaeramoeba flamelloides]